MIISADQSTVDSHRSRPRIAIIDQDRDFANSLETALTRSGFRVKLLSESAASLGSIRGAKPELICLGIQAPAIFSLFKKIRSDAELKDVAVLFVYDGNDPLIESTFAKHRQLKNHADGYLSRSNGSDIIAGVAREILGELDDSHETDEAPLIEIKLQDEQEEMLVTPRAQVEVEEPVVGLSRKRDLSPISKTPLEDADPISVVRRLRGQVELLQARVDQLRKHEQQLTGELARETANRKRLELENAELEKSAKQVEWELKKADSSLKKSKDELQKEKKALAEILRMRNEKLGKVEEVLNERVQELDELKGRVSAAERLAQEMEQQVVELSEERDAIKRELEKVVTQQQERIIGLEEEKRRIQELLVDSELRQRDAVKQREVVVEERAEMERRLTQTLERFRQHEAKQKKIIEAIASISDVLEDE